MRNSVLLSAVLAALLPARPLTAEDVGPGAPAMYVVDMQRVLDESIAGKAARNNIKEEMKRRESKLLIGRQELERLGAEIEKQAGLLSEDALKEKQVQLERKGRDFQREVQDQQEDLAKKNEEEIGKIVRQAQAIVKDLSSSKKLPFVLEKGDGFVVYVRDEYDLTPQVIKALDRKSLG